MSVSRNPFGGIGVSATNAAKAFRAFAGAGISVRAQTPFFLVRRRRDDYIVTWKADLSRDKEIYRWFRERGHHARFIDGLRHNGRYVKCSKDVALLAKLTWGGIG